MIAPSIFLRRTILLDAVASGAMGLLLAPGADLLTPLLGLPGILLRESGLFLIVYATAVGFLGTRARMPKLAVWVVIIANAVWAFDSIAFLFTGWVAPNLFGQAFILMQALSVAAISVLQYVGLKHSTPLTVAH